MTAAQLVQAMEEPATQDLRGYRLLPTLLKGLGTPSAAKLKRAVTTLRAWHRAGAHRRDLDRDGVDEETPAIELMDAWWPLLVSAEFKPALGPKAFERLEGMLQIGDHTGGSPAAPAFYDGWWGYVSKDLRAVFGPKPQAPFSRRYCGGGVEEEVPGAVAADAGGGAEGGARRSSTAAATASAPPTRSRPASTRTGRS